MENAMENEKKMVGCSGDCKKCNIYQHAYCASQMCLSSFPTLDIIVAKLDEMKAEIEGMKAERELTSPMLNKLETVKTQDDEL